MENDKKVQDDVRIEFTRTDADVKSAFSQGYATATRDALIGVALGTAIGAVVRYVQDRRHPVRAWARRVVR